MADEAFALSPISARAAQPSEEDYDAISKAFMETSRGRWFLGEYAKRNRNTDTSMVLEAVARLEQNLAAQRQPQQAPDNGLTEALAAIRSAVDEARVAALDGLALEEKLAPVRKGSRIIREIAWRWREIGADGRICDLIDAQIGAIEEACGEIASINPLTAFDVIERQLAEFGGSDAAPASQHTPAPDSASAAAPPTPTDEMLAALVVPLETPAAAPAEDPEVTAEAELVVAEAEETMAQTRGIAADTAEVTAEIVAPVAETTAALAEPADAVNATTEEAAGPLGLTAEADDDAILDMIALEMAADDPSEFVDVADMETVDVFGTGPMDAAAQPAETAAAAPAPADPVGVAPQPEPTAAEPPAVAPSLQASLQAIAEPSLGASLIARGILDRPQAAGPDPLAPIRRMSQAEKIAFFS